MINMDVKANEMQMKHDLIHYNTLKKSVWLILWQQINWKFTLAYKIETSLLKNHSVNKKGTNW